MRITTLIAVLLAMLAISGKPEPARAQLVVSISVAPPVLPVYVQPAIPGPGYIWTPGYWAWDDDVGDYYWVPGAWVLAPSPGLLWTPGYWGWSNGVYVWNAGYWGPRVGFYGGVNYGFGYAGVGFAGGYWVGGVFSYNKYCTNIGNNTTITNVYNKTVIVNNTTNVSYNGGSGGIQRQATQTEIAAAKEKTLSQTPDQDKHQRMARSDPSSQFKKNGGNPTIAATAKAGDFSKASAVAGKTGGAMPAAFHTTQALVSHNPGLHGTGDHKSNVNLGGSGKQNGIGGNQNRDPRNNYIRPKGMALNNPPRKLGPHPQPKRVNQPKGQQHHDGKHP
jgi:hypothetical protein